MTNDEQLYIDWINKKPFSELFTLWKNKNGVYFMELSSLRTLTEMVVVDGKVTIRDDNVGSMELWEKYFRK